MGSKFTLDFARLVLVGRKQRPKMEITLSKFSHISDKNLQKEHLWLLINGQRWNPYMYIYICITTHIFCVQFPTVFGVSLSRSSAWNVT